MDKRLKESLKLDKAYADAADFDAKRFDEWVRKNFEALCRRTAYPKLGYIIHKLNEAGIPCLLHGSTAHAENILWVDKRNIEEANKVLDERHGRYRLDDVRDDHPKFLKYKDEQPESLEDWTGDPSRDQSVPGDR